MKQPLFPSTIGTQSRFAYFLSVKAVVRKFGKSDSQTGSWGLDKAVVAQGAANTFNSIERVYNRAIAFSNRRCSVPLESSLPMTLLCTSSSSIRTWLL